MTENNRQTLICGNCGKIPDGSAAKNGGNELIGSVDRLRNEGIEKAKERGCRRPQLTTDGFPG
jgi:hypothetical protein